MATRHRLSPELVERFSSAVTALDQRFADDANVMIDDNQDATVRGWLDEAGTLPWAGDGVTPDEWFFITTLYGEMTMDGQRTHIRTFFPRWIERTRGDMAAVTPDLLSDWKLRSSWMKSRLARMARILNDRQMSMSDCVRSLQGLESDATPENPMPALDAIVADHQATGWKTLSVFVRDCVGGNCFPIDSRVAKELDRHELPQDERLLVGLSLAVDHIPRQVARMFFSAGGE